MIAENEFRTFDQPILSLSKSNVVFLIIESMKQTVPLFKHYMSQKHYSKSRLNEDDLTQIYVEQAQILIRKHEYPFNINREYRDLYNQSKGYSDFYFYPNEQGISLMSLFSVESKRLPAPDITREKEYVIGNSNNGGIERYKTEKHGKGMHNCGLLGFLEKENSPYWETVINSWIIELASQNKVWRDDEVLSISELNPDYTYLTSVVYTFLDELNLSHLWITLS